MTSTDCPFCSWPEPDPEVNDIDSMVMRCCNPECPESPCVVTSLRGGEDEAHQRCGELWEEMCEAVAEGEDW